MFYSRPQSVTAFAIVKHPQRLSILWSSVIAFCMKSIGSVYNSLSCRPATLLVNHDDDHHIHSIPSLRFLTLKPTACSLMTSRKLGGYGAVQNSVCSICLLVSVRFLAAEFQRLCLCGMAGAPAVYCFENNTLSRTEKFGFGMCSSTSGCLTNDKCCPTAAEIKLREGFERRTRKSNGLF